MNQKTKFSLMTAVSVIGLIGFIVMMCNANRVFVAAKGVGGFVIGLIAVAAVFNVMLFFVISTGMQLKYAADAQKAKKAKADAEAAQRAAAEQKRREEEEAAERARQKAEAAARSEEEERARMAAILAAAEEDDEEGAEEEESSDADAEEEKADEGEIVDATTGLKITVRYRRSFMARLIQSREKLQDYYTGLKNVLLSFEGVKSRVSWNYDSFNRGRKQLAKMNIRGKSLMLYLALDPKQFEDTKYFYTDVSDKLKFAKVPLRIKVRSGRGFKYGVELIEEMMRQLGVVRQEIYHPQDFHMPYETTEQLIDRGLIKVVTPEEEEKLNASFDMENLADFIRDEVTVAEADALVTDDIVKVALKHVVREHEGNKKTYINLDTICENFEDGAVVNLVALKEKKLIPADVGHIKVLARGRMTKQMTIEADDFSTQAIKMIVLTGGEVVEVN